jgi:hypothetical protein
MTKLAPARRKSDHHPIELATAVVLAGSMAKADDRRTLHRGYLTGNLVREFAHRLGVVATHRIGKGVEKCTSARLRFHFFDGRPGR